MYDYLLGGKDNFAADRAVADQISAQPPAVQVGVRAQRHLLGRVVRYLVGEAGLRQLLDIGSGLPTAENVHEIAHRIDPATRVVYLDNDPVVLAHARALLADDTVTFAVAGDLRDPAGLLADPDVREHLDWDQPIGLLLCGIPALHPGRGGSPAPSLLPDAKWRGASWRLAPRASGSRPGVGTGTSPSSRGASGGRSG